MSHSSSMKSSADAANTSEAVISKRRSSVFQRRSINPQQSEYNETVTEEKTSEIPSNSASKIQEDTFDLASYISSIKNEKEAWKKVLNERKSQRRHLVKAELKAREGVELDLTVLTEAERAFLSERPDYESDCGKMEDLLKLATKVAALNMEMHHLHETITQRLSERIERIGEELVNSPES